MSNNTGLKRIEKEKEFLENDFFSVSTMFYCFFERTQAKKKQLKQKARQKVNKFV